MAEATAVETAGEVDDARAAEHTPEHTPEVPAVRRWAIGWTTGVAQALGAALLLISEFVREDVATLGRPVPRGTRLPDYAADFTSVRHTLADQSWYRLVEDVHDAVTVDEARAALWAAVCMALVVRFNKEGPPRVQCVLSLLSAAYCVLLVVTGIPYLALAGFALPFALVLGAVAVVAATRRG